MVENFDRQFKLYWSNRRIERIKEKIVGKRKGFFGVKNKLVGVCLWE
jgi:hypothetical protein